MTDDHPYLPAKINGRGQCCGRKPIPYKRPPHLFCMRCHRSFDPETGQQIDNWKYKRVGEYFYTKAREPRHVCDHIPKKSALDNSIGCIRCGEWLGDRQ